MGMMMIVVLGVVTSIRSTADPIPARYIASCVRLFQAHEHTGLYLKLRHT